MGRNQKDRNQKGIKFQTNLPKGPPHQETLIENEFRNSLYQEIEVDLPHEMGIIRSLKIQEILEILEILEMTEITEILEMGEKKDLGLEIVVDEAQIIHQVLAVTKRST